MQMRALSEGELLAVWEQGMTQSPLQRALLLLAAAMPEWRPENLARLSIGQRDTLLLALRALMLGPQAESVASCPACGATVALTLDIAQLQAEAETALAAGEHEELALKEAAYTVRFRLPTSVDLAAMGNGDERLLRERLFERCVISAEHDGKPVAQGDLPSAIVEGVIERMAQADPQADIRIALACPECEHRWQVAFDIASFFWHEVAVRAQRILRDVHELAHAYGWSESAILAMTSQRRYLYLELLHE